MAKKAPRRQGTAHAAPRPAAGDVPVVGAREACPCGSGRRYKACHGRQAGVAEQFVAFEGLAGECDWVALREIVPSATAGLTLAKGRSDAAVTLATVLPMAWPALVRQDGGVLLGLQTTGGSGDPSREVAHALEQALEAQPGTPVSPDPAPGPGPRLQDLLDTSATLDVQVHPGFDFWIEGVEDRSPEVVASMERANEAVVPTARLSGVEAAYWCEIRGRYHLRWVMRAHGLMVPVWDLEPGTSADALEDPVTVFSGRLQEALADGRPLDTEARRARAGLASRQLTLR
jgi:hypothetical protein